MGKAIVLLLMMVMLSSSGFQPISNGQILWLNENSNGEYVLITYTDMPYDNVKLSYYYNESIYSSQDMLLGKPDSFSVSGCGHHIAVAASVSGTVYVNRIVVPINVACGDNKTTVYIPIINR